MSLDIDLFTNAEYGSIDFNGITRFLQKHFLYVDSIKLKPEGLGKAFFADNDFDPVCLKSKYWEVIKLDMMDFVNDYLSR